VAPARPHCLGPHPLGNVQDKVHVGIVVVVRAARHRHTVVRQLDVLCTRGTMHAIAPHHDDKADGLVVAEHLVRPSSNGAHAFYCRNAVV
ncbi:unnamed protein product, partial [Ixodes persulcatus]